MMLFVNGIVQGIQCNHVGFWVADLDSAFDLLTGLVHQNWSLEQATFVDGYQRISLPVDAFDGQPVRSPLENLQSQWQALLATPIQRDE